MSSLLLLSCRLLLSLMFGNILFAILDWNIRDLEGCNFAMFCASLLLTLNQFMSLHNPSAFFFNISVQDLNLCYSLVPFDFCAESSGPVQIFIPVLLTKHLILSKWKFD